MGGIDAVFLIENEYSSFKEYALGAFNGCTWPDGTGWGESLYSCGCSSFSTGTGTGNGNYSSSGDDDNSGEGFGYYRYGSGYTDCTGNG